MDCGVACSALFGGIIIGSCVYYWGIIYRHRARPSFCRFLRQAKLKPRPAAILKWEGIVVDPFGALLAVFAFEFIRFLNGEVTLNAFYYSLQLPFLQYSLVGGLPWVLGGAFERGGVPEFLKSPVLFAVVIFTFVFADEIMHETGLLAVTAMGMTMANMHLTSMQDIRHFKENISVLLISGIFVMLTASLNPQTLIEIFNPNIMMYVLAMLFIVRPLSIWISTIGTELERARKDTDRLDCAARNCSANCVWLFCNNFTRTWLSRR